ncbi:glycosyltransferase [Amycolatopsis sp. YIM 10]|uniref:glycosyltransferase n=1 Tax=Amycolatopsis sp. YIM 10 TaxID=2653857 RepID=UPI0021048965|nr:glycosyltransferase [Amycolatopsis sp. YIM 10]
MAEVLPWLLEQANVIHQCGPAAVEAMRQRADQVPDELASWYRPLGFVGAELADVFALTEVVISRNGAGTIAELTALGLPSVLVPSAGGEQAHNARHLVDAGAARALLGVVTPVALWDALAPLLSDRDARSAMARRAREQGRPDAADQLVERVVEAAHASGC